MEFNSARIFLLDSLGAEHPAPRRILGHYLLQEAHDKKQIPEDALNDPDTKQWFQARISGHNVKVCCLFFSHAVMSLIIHFVGSCAAEPLRLWPLLIALCGNIFVQSP